MDPNGKGATGSGGDSGRAGLTVTDQDPLVRFFRILWEWDARPHRMGPSKTVIEGAHDDGSDESQGDLN